MKSRTYSTLVIEDDPTIREALVNRLQESPNWKVLGEAQSAAEALEKVIKLKPQSLFLDIKLRESDAFSLLDMLESIKLDIPPVILNTAFADFEYAQKALNGYAQEIILLLKKPFWEKWAEHESEILSKLDGIYKENEEIRVDGDVINLRVGSKTYFIKHDDVLFLEVESTHSAKSKLCATDQVIIINKTLSKVKLLLPKQFVQISRQTIINKNKIKEYSHEDHTLTLRGIKNRRFDVGMAFKKNIM